MVFRRWQEATQSIIELTGRCTPEQLAIASAAGLRMRSALPRLVAAARLRQHLHPSLGTDPPRPVHPYQRDVLAELALEPQKREPKCDTAAEADAWIQYLRLRLRSRMLRRLRLCEGDIIRRSMADPDEVDAVSSIGGDGRVYLRGGKGARAWPDTLTMVARSADKSAHAAEWRRKAANRAAQRAHGESWSSAKAAMLEPYAVADGITESDIEELRDIVESAKDERPLQQFIEDHPTVLASLLGGHHGLYCVPHPRLGTAYVPDFLIASVDSAGVRWVLVELETPRSRVTLAKKNDLDQHARAGVAQVLEWREWLQNNLEYARRPLTEGGLGLAGVRPQDEGLVLVGRREFLRPNHEQVRRQTKEDRRIQIHTYDWLLERLEGVHGFKGPSASNPHILCRDMA